MSRLAIRPAVMAYLVKHTGKPVQVNDLVSATGFSLTQIQAAMRNLIRDDAPVRVIHRARIWVYDPEPKTEPKTEPETEPETEDVTDEIFEGIGRTRSGAIIVRDGKGILYVAREMDV